MLRPQTAIILIAVQSRGLRFKKNPTRHVHLLLWVLPYGVQVVSWKNEWWKELLFRSNKVNFYLACLVSDFNMFKGNTNVFWEKIFKNYDFFFFIHDFQFLWTNVVHICECYILVDVLSGQRKLVCLKRDRAYHMPLNFLKFVPFFRLINKIYISSIGY